ncbi:hypothetical protein [Rhodopila sp.]|uniref:hypothetical protein n=1 Tax=Rhodopila sp. TaxID=2480087 RepID=UPI003D1249B3
MHKSDFWTDWANAMELSVQGNRVIAREIGELAERLWRRLGRGVSGAVGGARPTPPPT